MGEAVPRLLMAPDGSGGRPELRSTPMNYGASGFKTPRVEFPIVPSILMQPDGFGSKLDVQGFGFNQGKEKDAHNNELDLWVVKELKVHPPASAVQVAPTVARVSEKGTLCLGLITFMPTAQRFLHKGKLRVINYGYSSSRMAMCTMYILKDDYGAIFSACFDPGITETLLCILEGGLLVGEKHEVLALVGDKPYSPVHHQFRYLLAFKGGTDNTVLNRCRCCSSIGFLPSHIDYSYYSAVSRVCFDPGTQSTLGSYDKVVAGLNLMIRTQVIQNVETIIRVAAIQSLRTWFYLLVGVYELPGMHDVKQGSKRTFAFTQRHSQDTSLRLTTTNLEVLSYSLALSRVPARIYMVVDDVPAYSRSWITNASTGMAEGGYLGCFSSLICKGQQFSCASKIIFDTRIYGKHKFNNECLQNLVHTMVRGFGAPNKLIWLQIVGTSSEFRKRDKAENVTPVGFATHSLFKGILGIRDSSKDTSGLIGFARVNAAKGWAGLKGNAKWQCVILEFSFEVGQGSDCHQPVNHLSITRRVRVLPYVVRLNKKLGIARCKRIGFVFVIKVDGGFSFGIALCLKSLHTPTTQGQPHIEEYFAFLSPTPRPLLMIYTQLLLSLDTGLQRYLVFQEATKFLMLVSSVSHGAKGMLLMSLMTNIQFLLNIVVASPFCSGNKWIMTRITHKWATYSLTWSWIQGHPVVYKIGPFLVTIWKEYTTVLSVFHYLIMVSAFLVCDVVVVLGMLYDSGSLVFTRSIPLPAKFFECSSNILHGLSALNQTPGLVKYLRIDVISTSVQYVIAKSRRQSVTSSSTESLAKSVEIIRRRKLYLRIIGDVRYNYKLHDGLPVIVSLDLGIDNTDCSHMNVSDPWNTTPLLSDRSSTTVPSAGVSTFLYNGEVRVRKATISAELLSLKICSWVVETEYIKRPRTATMCFDPGITYQYFGTTTLPASTLPQFRVLFRSMDYSPQEFCSTRSAGISEAYHVPSWEVDPAGAHPHSWLAKELRITLIWEEWHPYVVPEWSKMTLVMYDLDVKATCFFTFRNLLLLGVAPFSLGLYLPLQLAGLCCRHVPDDFMIGRLEAGTSKDTLTEAATAALLAMGKFYALYEWHGAKKRVRATDIAVHPQRLDFYKCFSVYDAMMVIHCWSWLGSGPATQTVLDSSTILMS